MDDVIHSIMTRKPSLTEPIIEYFDIEPIEPNIIINNEKWQYDPKQDVARA